MKYDLKKIKEFDGYFVSTTGEVLSNRKTKLVALKPWFIQNKQAVKLRRNKKYVLKFVDRLVAEHFIFNPNRYPEIAHKDGSRLNNNIDNLEWVSSFNGRKNTYTNDWSYNDNFEHLFKTLSFYYCAYAKIFGKERADEMWYQQQIYLKDHLAREAWIIPYYYRNNKKQFSIKKSHFL